MKLIKAVSFVAIAAVGGANAAIDIDIAVIGGGGSGAYAAVRLREDFGKKIVVVEKQNRLVRIPISNIALHPEVVT